MSELKDQANEIKACCCVEIGSIIDGSDCVVKIDRSFASQTEAEEALHYLTEKARAAESEPCVISSAIEPIEQGVRLSATFEFACQAEAMIFQLATR